MSRLARIRPPRRWALAAVALALAALAGCARIGDIVSTVTANTGEFPVEVNGVTISARPQRVVVLSPGLADVILALGRETQLAAGSETCTQASLRSLEKINGNDPQAVLDQNPDLVLAESFDSAMGAALENANIPALAIEPAADRESFERLYAKVSTALAGEGAGYDDGIRAAQDIFTTLDDINRVAPKDKITTACYLYDLDGKAVTGDLFGDTIMSYAGVTNVFKSLSGGEYEFESLRIANPTVIFCAPGLEQALRADSRFENFQAVKNGRIFELDRSYMEWQGRTVITAALEIAGDSFPELLEESSMEVTDPTESIESAVSAQIESSALEEDTTAYPTLQTGDDNDDVLRLQTRLDELGYLDAEYDGYYGSTTAGCVEDFQRDNGLEATGIADAETQRRLYNKYAKTKAEAAQESAAQAE